MQNTKSRHIQIFVKRGKIGYTKKGSLRAPSPPHKRYKTVWTKSTRKAKKHTSYNVEEKKFIEIVMTNMKTLYSEAETAEDTV